MATVVIIEPNISEEENLANLKRVEEILEDILQCEMNKLMTKGA